GREGQFSFSYDGYLGQQSPTQLIKPVNGLDHMNLINEAHTNVGRSPLFSEDYIANYIANKATDPDTYPDSDCQKAQLTGSGVQPDHVLSVTGGTERVKFFGSFGYLLQAGLIENVDFQRYYCRLNSNVRISDKLSGSFDLYV